MSSANTKADWFSPFSEIQRDFTIICAAGQFIKPKLNQKGPSCRALPVR